MKKDNLLISLAMILVTLFSFSSLIFVNYEMQVFETNLKASFEKEQQNIGTEMGRRLQLVGENGASDEQIVEAMLSNGIQGSRRWTFLCKNGQVLYYKSASETKNSVARKETMGQLVERLSNTENIVTTEEFTIGGNQYVLGIVTNEDVILLDGKVSKHRTYVVIVYVVLCFTFLIALLHLLGNIQKLKRRMKEKDKQISEKNKIIEVLAEEKMNLQQKEFLVSAKEPIWYDNNVLQEFLRKSDQEALRPLTMVGIRILFPAEYVSEETLVNVLTAMKGVLTKKCVLTQLARGEYVILIYKTNKDNLKELLHKLSQCLEEKVVPLNLSYRIYVNEEAGSQETVKERFKSLFIRLHEQEESDEMV